MDSITPETRNIANIKNGKFDTQTRCSCRLKRDPYKASATHLEQKEKEIHNFTDCNVLVDTVCDCQGGKDGALNHSTIKIHKKKMNNESANAEATVEVTLVFTQQKRKCGCFDSS